MKIKEMAKGYGQSAKGALRQGKGLIGNMTAPMTLNPVKALKNGWQATKDFVGGSVDHVKGLFNILKGIFNDPNWWKGESGMPSIAMNPQRPFSPKQLSDWYYNRVSAGGVGHLSYVNVKFSDLRDAEWFNIAVDKIFQSMRSGLKSNLPYNRDDVADYLLAVLSLTLRAKGVERTLGWYNQMSLDVPELAHGLTHCSYDFRETGTVNTVSRGCYDQESLGTIFQRCEVLKTLLSNIILPTKFIELASWINGSVFTDEDLINPQIYVLDVRQMPRYYQGSTRWESTIIDPAIHDSVDILINDANSIIRYFGVIMADLSKLGMIGSINYVLPSQFVPQMLCDYEFFNAIINGYTERGTAIVESLNKSGGAQGIRYDIMPKITMDAFVGSMILGGSLTGSSMLSILSQGFAYLVDHEHQFIDSRDTIVNTLDSGSVTVDLHHLSDQDYVVYQYNSRVIDQVIAQTAEAAQDIELFGNYQNRVTWPSSVTTYAESIVLDGPETYEVSYFTDDRLRYNYFKLGERPGTDVVLYLRIDIQEAAVTGVKLALITNEHREAIWSDEVLDWARADIVTEPDATYFDFSVRSSSGPYREAYLLCMWNLLFESIGRVTVTQSSVKSIVKGLMVSENNASIRWILAAWFTVTVTTGSYAVTLSNDAAKVALVIQNWDYHIPFVISKDIQYDYVGSNTNAHAAIKYDAALLKECYTPVFITEDEVRSTQFLMQYNLMSMTATELQKAKSEAKYNRVKDKDKTK